MPETSQLPIARARQFALDLLGTPADSAAAATFWAEITSPEPPAIPDITVCYCLVRVGNASYCLLEFVSGQTLEQLCREVDPASCERVIPMISRLLDACENLPAQPVRRVRWPGRWNIGRSGQIRISDLGIARASGPGRGRQTLWNCNDWPGWILVRGDSQRGRRRVLRLPAADGRVPGAGRWSAGG